MIFPSVLYSLHIKVWLDPILDRLSRYAQLKGHKLRAAIGRLRDFEVIKSRDFLTKTKPSSHVVFTYSVCFQLCHTALV